MACTNCARKDKREAKVEPPTNVEISKSAETVIHITTTWCAHLIVERPVERVTTRYVYLPSVEIDGQRLPAQQVSRRSRDVWVELKDAIRERMYRLQQKRERAMAKIARYCGEENTMRFALETGVAPDSGMRFER